MSDYQITQKNKIVRGAKRAVYDIETIHGILDAGFLCHLGFNIHNEPFIIPTAYARDGEKILVHGSVKSRAMKESQSGIPVCVCVTHLDGLVLARSAFHHSVNYRSAIIYGQATEILDPAEKNHALMLITESVLKGRWSEVRQPNEKELEITSVLSIEIESASAKVRTGGPVDDKEDYDLSVWAGVLPISPVFGKPVQDEQLKEGIPISRSVVLAG